MSSTPFMFRILNPVMKFVLKSPLHGLVSDQIMIITFQGAKSGKTYATPVSYFREGDVVYCFTHSRWWKNFVRGADVRVRLKGKPYTGHAVAEAEDVAQIAEGLRKMLKAVPRDAVYYDVTFNADGEPNMDEVTKAAKDAVMVKITL